MTFQAASIDGANASWKSVTKKSIFTLSVQYLILEEKLSISSILLHFILILTPFVDLLKHEAFNVCNVILMFFILFLIIIVCKPNSPYNKTISL